MARFRKDKPKASGLQAHKPAQTAPAHEDAKTSSAKSKKTAPGRKSKRNSVGDADVDVIELVTGPEEHDVCTLQS